MDYIIVCLTYHVSDFAQQHTNVFIVFQSFVSLYANLDVYIQRSRFYT